MASTRRKRKRIRKKRTKAKRKVAVKRGKHKKVRKRRRRSGVVQNQKVTVKVHVGGEGQKTRRRRKRRRKGVGARGKVTAGGVTTSKGGFVNPGPTGGGDPNVNTVITRRTLMPQGTLKQIEPPPAQGRQVRSVSVANGSGSREVARLQGDLQRANDDAQKERRMMMVLTRQAQMEAQRARDFAEFTASGEGIHRQNQQTGMPRTGVVDMPMTEVSSSDGGSDDIPRTEIDSNESDNDDEDFRTPSNSPATSQVSAPRTERSFEDPVSVSSGSSVRSDMGSIMSRIRRVNLFDTDRSGEEDVQEVPKARTKATKSTRRSDVVVGTPRFDPGVTEEEAAAALDNGADDMLVLEVLNIALDASEKTKFTSKWLKSRVSTVPAGELSKLARTLNILAGKQNGRTNSSMIPGSGYLAKHFDPNTL